MDKARASVVSYAPHFHAYSTSGTVEPRSHKQLLIIDKLGFKQNYYTFTLILLMSIVMCGKFI